MEIWETIEFGARAVLLKSAASESLEEIERLARSRLEQLVAYARADAECGAGFDQFRQFRRFGAKRAKHDWK